MSAAFLNTKLCFQFRVHFPENISFEPCMLIKIFTLLCHFKNISLVSKGLKSIISSKIILDMSNTFSCRFESIVS